MNEQQKEINKLVKEGMKRTRIMFTNLRKAKLSEKGKLVRKHLSTMDSSLRPHFEKVVSAILGEDVSTSAQLGVVTGAFAVPKKAKSKHAYRDGVAFFVPSTAQNNGNGKVGACVYHSNGKTGRNIPVHALRPATETQIKAFFKEALDRKLPVVRTTLTQETKVI